jgi:hypothetical protein
MALSMYQASVPVFQQMLAAMADILDKAEKHAAEQKFEQAALLGTRLYPNMWPLLRQVQVACDFAKGTAARLAAVDVPVFEDNETTLAELKGRIARTQTFLAGLKPEQIDGSEKRRVTIRMGGKEVAFEGQPYLIHFALPNFYFHCTTTYDILRQAGLGLVKRDFIGAIPGQG